MFVTQKLYERGVKKLTVYENLAQYIDDNHLNKVSIARDMGIDSTKLNATVNGKRKMDIEEFRRFCEVAKVSPAKIMGLSF